MDKLILGSIILDRFVTRLFSEKLGWLPNWTNFLDYPLLVVFAVYVLLSLRERRKPSGFAPLMWGLFMIFGVSALANLDRLHPGAVTLFFVGLFEPLAYMALAYALVPRQEVLNFLVKVLFFVGWLQITVVLLMDLPRFLVTGNPDVISGTFGENAYQMTFVLMAWNALILSGKPAGRFRDLWFLGVVGLQGLILGIILLAQFRAFIPFALITWGLTYVIVNRAPGRAIVGAGLGVGLFLTAFFVVNAWFPELKYGEFLELSSRRDEVIRAGKVQSVLNFFDLVDAQPQVLLIGTGPGTYASRGFRTFSIAGKTDAANIFYRDAFHADFYVTDVAARYVLPVANLYAFGSATTAVPWFSFLSIPAELGLFGLALVLAIYGKAIRLAFRAMHRPNSQGMLARWAFIALILLLQMAFIENWLEVSRLTVPVWIVFGVVLAQSHADKSSSDLIA